MNHRAPRLAFALVGLCATLNGCTKCPKPVEGWQDRRLTIADMTAALAPWIEERAREAYGDCGGCSGDGCDPAPIGIDPRVGLPVYLRLHCDDVCPDQARFIVTYGDEYRGNAACEALGMCAIQGGADLGISWCTPFNQRGFCWSSAVCNWNGVCEPDRGETPGECPVECPCGAGITGPTEDRLAAQVLVSDPEAPPDSACITHNGTALPNVLDRLGALYAEVLGTFDATTEVQQTVSDGRFPLLLRLQAPDLAEAPYAVLRVAVAAPLGAPPRFDGTDVVTWPVPADGVEPLCGSVSGASATFAMNLHEADVPLGLPFPGLEQVALPLASPWIGGTRDATGWRDVDVLALVSSADVITLLPEAIAAYLNDRIDAEPLGPEAASLAQTLDGQCDPFYCPGEAPGVGECAASDPPHISATEVRCRRGFHSVLTSSTAPGDQIEERLCYRYRITRAVPVTTVEPADR